uniref:CSON006165 protein n=1 Tax=Culicoides sonorensis TaxID=179676 RepID=A0A336MY47_CULSO
MDRTRIFLFIFIGVFLQCESIPFDSPTYSAAVVEYHKIRFLTNPEKEATTNLNAYIELIQNTTDVDIIIFPESTLNNYETGVTFDVDPLQIPCGNDSFGQIINLTSCASKNTKKYVSINLVETSLCPDQQQIEFNDTRPCPSDKINKYNTNVVFDRNGAIISKYRKFNLYGEKEVIHPLYPEAVTFETDFGVTFGHIICFDILFSEPTMDLVLKKGITDLIFPSMWFSKAPFLTASQIQQSFAYANDINLLAAGASDPIIGSTGTGIYHGRKGALVSVMSHEPRSKVYKAIVPKMRGTNTVNPPSIQAPERSTPTQMLNLFLKKDNTEPFTTFELTSEGQIQQKLCNGIFCCYFDLTLQYINSTSENKYQYRLIAYDGLRTFKREAVQICAILACSSSDVNSCGQRFTATNVDYNSVLFKNIKIETTIQWKNVLVMPSSLDFSILPYDVNDFNLIDNENADGFFSKLELKTPKNDIYCFGLYVRNYDGDR